jgi:hypothetical protein
LSRIKFEGGDIEMMMKRDFEVRTREERSDSKCAGCVLVHVTEHDLILDDQ